MGRAELFARLVSSVALRVGGAFRSWRFANCRLSPYCQATQPDSFLTLFEFSRKPLTDQPANSF
jgi:hypothetical protein